MANAVHTKGTPLENCWDFIDGTVRPIFRPTENQRIVSNGHKRVHAIKFQSVVTSNGSLANLSGPYEGTKHDIGMLADSRLLSLLQVHSVTPAGSSLCLYEDIAYPLRVHRQTPFRGNDITLDQTLYNKKMSQVRTAVEWISGDILNFSAFLDFKKDLKLGLSAVGKMYVTCALLKNAHTCILWKQHIKLLQNRPT